ncbi:MAG: hypothetical protein ACKOFI_04675, partial [Phycisphaerales bacterium]
MVRGGINRGERPACIGDRALPQCVGVEAGKLQAQVSVPIFNDGRFRVQAAERDVELARLDADALRQRAVADARRALAAVD